MSIEPAASAPPVIGSIVAGAASAATRWLAWSAAAVMTLGSMLFLYGGRMHPGIGAAAGTGVDDFFRGFAGVMLHTSGWQAMHMLILVGPLCWAVAAPVLLDAIHPGARAFTSAARSTLLLSGALWAVAFALDGFGGPVYAAALVTSAGSSIEPGVLASFQANATIMSRLGLVSWIALGLGMVLLSGSLLAPHVRSAWRSVVAISGIALGAWPLGAALQGEYATGPFTSGYWMMNALAVGLWFIALASCSVRRAR